VCGADSIARPSIVIYGHGTHVTGTLAGNNGIGMAPNATWVHAKAFDRVGLQAGSSSKATVASSTLTSNGAICDILVRCVAAGIQIDS
jgi:hypothetical protein